MKYNLLCQTLRGVSIMIPAFNILYRNSSSPTFQVNNNMPDSTSL